MLTKENLELLQAFRRNREIRSRRAPLVDSETRWITLSYDQGGRPESSEFKPLLTAFIITYGGFFATSPVKSTIDFKCDSAIPIEEYWGDLLRLFKTFLQRGYPDFTLYFTVKPVESLGTSDPIQSDFTEMRDEVYKMLEDEKVILF